MAGSDLSDSAGGDAVAGYLAAVAARLPGPPAARVAVIDELRDGLLEALQAHQGRGGSSQEATLAVLAEFGDPDRVAAAFGPELAAGQARRVALGLLVTGPGVGLSWVAVVVVNALAPWRHQLTGPWLALPLVGLALAVAGPALGVAVAVTGRLGRGLGRGFGRRGSVALTAAAVAALAAVVADLTLLGILGGQVLSSPGSLVWAPVMVAVGASLSRGVVAGWAARRCLASRAALR